MSVTAIFEGRAGRMAAFTVFFHERRDNRPGVKIVYPEKGHTADIRQTEKPL